MGNPRTGAYAELWGVVDGAVTDAFNTHPDYLTAKGQRSARTSVTKRVTGTVLSFAVQAARGRVGPAETSDGVATPRQAGEGVVRAFPNPHCRIGLVKFKRRTRYRAAGVFDLMTSRLLASMPNSLPAGRGM